MHMVVLRRSQPDLGHEAEAGRVATHVRRGGVPIRQGHLGLTHNAHGLCMQCLDRREPDLGHGAEAGGVAKHVRQGHLGLDHHILPLPLAVLDQPLAPIYIPNDGPLELSGRPDLKHPTQFFMSDLLPLTSLRGCASNARPKSECCTARPGDGCMQINM